jgi:hypothetical protein
MHGTFRAQATGGAVTTVRFAARPVPPPHRWRSTLAALLAGSCIAVLPGVPRVVAPVAKSSSAVKPRQAADRSALPAARHEAHRSRRLVAVRESTPREPQAVIRIVLPEPTLVAVDIPRPTQGGGVAAAVTSSPQPRALPSDPAAADTLAGKQFAADLPSPASAFPKTSPVATPRPVDIAQISDSEVRSLNVPELREPGLAAGSAPTLSAKIAAMQVTPLPPVRLRDSDRAALLAEAPTRMTVRIGGSALGKVDFRMGDARTIDVSLGNLLDLLAGHYDAAEFARLRTSAAADAYVSFDQLRALGLNVRYDPVYDELRING